MISEDDFKGELESLKGDLVAPHADLIHSEAARRGRVRKRGRVAGLLATSFVLLAAGGWYLNSTSLASDQVVLAADGVESPATTEALAADGVESPATTEAPGEAPATDGVETPGAGLVEAEACQVINRTPPPDWEGAPINQSLNHAQHGYIAEVSRGSSEFYPGVCFDDEASVPLCVLTWNLSDPAGAIPEGVQRIDNGELVATFGTTPESWSEASESFPAECFQ